jgi:hypothetical protein
VTVEDVVLALLVIAAAAPVVVPLVEWLCKGRATKTTAGAGASPTPAPAVPHPRDDVEAARDADQ